MSPVAGLSRPRPLAPGDRVAVVATSGPVRPDLLASGVEVLRDWGLVVDLAEHLRDAHPTLPFLAGSDADRAADLQRAWLDPEVAGVICARGGYGAQRMVDLVDWDALAKVEPKVFAGSSDVTALHEAVAARLGQVTFFAPMIGTTAFDEVAQAGLRSALLAPEAGLVLTGPEAGALVPGVTGGTATGLLVGGNLSLLASSLGTASSWPLPTGSILLLEDVEEEPYRLDRYLVQLDRAGYFDGVAGVALGSWVDCGPVEEVRAVLVDRLAGLGVPVGWEIGFGHCARQHTVPLGVQATLDADAGTLTLLG